MNESFTYLAEYLSALHTRELGRAQELFDTLDSTNAYLKREHTAGRAPAGAVAIALRQTAGRGRLGRTWESIPGAGLYFSLLAPRLPMERLSLVPVAVGVAAAAALQEIAEVTAGIKWPNDLIVSDRKLSGILCEGVLGRAVCGIGVNLLQDAAFFVRAELPHGTSLLLETGRVVSAPRLAAEIVNRLEPWLDELSAGKIDALIDRFRENCVSIGREVRAISPTGELAGIAVDVDAEGRLVIEHADGCTAVSAGEVQLRTVRGYL